MILLLVQKNLFSTFLNHIGICQRQGSLLTLPVLIVKIKFNFGRILSPLLALSSCASPNPEPTPFHNEINGSQMVIFSGQDDLSSHIALGTLSKSTDTNGLLHVILPVHNSSDLDLYLDYRVTYFDENHTPIDLPGPWETKTLHSNRSEFIQVNASTPRARDFQIELRWAR